MGGRIEVQSQPGRGSTFEFSVPLVIADCVPPKAEAALQNTRPLRILLAEDNRINRHIASQMLERLGHSVSIAENGCKALELSAAESFDAVLMDIQMPELDGLAATRAIRERESTGGPRLPIIALTAHAMSGDEAECLGAGMDAYLSKPIQQDALRQVLARFAAPPPQDRTINTGAFTP
jgi:CheY-like chemotaxis protein